MYQMLQITYISQSSSTQYRSRNCDFHVFFIYILVYINSLDRIDRILRFLLKMNIEI